MAHANKVRAWGLRDMVEFHMGMTFNSKVALDAYAEIGGAIGSKEDFTAFELAYMRRMFSA